MTVTVSGDGTGGVGGELGSEVDMAAIEVVLQDRKVQTGPAPLC